MSPKIKRIVQKLKKIKTIEKEQFKRIEKGTPIFKPKNINKKKLNEFWNKFLQKEIKGKTFDASRKREYHKITPTVLGTIRLTDYDHATVYKTNDLYLNSLSKLYTLQSKIKPKKYIFAPVEILDYIKYDNYYYVLERAIPSINGERLIQECILERSSNPYIKSLLRKTGFDHSTLVLEFNKAYSEFKDSLDYMQYCFDIHRKNILISGYDTKQKKFILHFIDVIAMDPTI